MKHYTLTELGNKSGEIVEAAHKGPVDITSRGKRKYVLMSAEHYDWIIGRGTQKAYSTDSMTDDEREHFLEGLDTLANKLEFSDE